MWTSSVPLCRVPGPLLTHPSRTLVPSSSSHALQAVSSLVEPPTAHPSLSPLCTSTRTPLRPYHHSTTSRSEASKGEAKGDEKGELKGEKGEKKGEGAEEEEDVSPLEVPEDLEFPVYKRPAEVVEGIYAMVQEKFPHLEVRENDHGFALHTKVDVEKGTVVIEELPAAFSTEAHPSPSTCRTCLKTTSDLMDGLYSTKYMKDKAVIDMSAQIHAITDRIASASCNCPRHGALPTSPSEEEFVNPMYSTKFQSSLDAFLTKQKAASVKMGEPEDYDVSIMALATSVMNAQCVSLFESFKKGMSEKEALAEATRPIDALMARPFEKAIASRSFPDVPSLKETRNWIRNTLTPYFPTTVNGKAVRCVHPDLFDYQQFAKVYFRLNLNYIQVVAYSPFAQLLSGSPGLQKELEQLSQEVDQKKLDEVLSDLDVNMMGYFGRGIGLYPVTALMNHNCIPSVIPAETTDRTAKFSAGRDLKAGEELTIAYVDASDSSPYTFDERQKFLFSKHFFKCACKTDCTIGAEHPMDAFKLGEEE